MFFFVYNQLIYNNTVFYSQQLGSGMDLNLLQIFTAIAENRSFTKAANLLNMDKSTVSAKLSQLETNLGIRLLNRSTRSVSLTEAGIGYLRYCQQISETANEAEQYAKTLKDDAVGVLRVSASNSFSKYIISDLIKPFMAENPKVIIDLVLDYQNVDLVRDRIDLALRLDVGGVGLKDSSLIAKKVTSTSAGLFCSPAYHKKLGGIESIEQLQSADFIEFTRGNSFDFIYQLQKSDTENLEFNKRLKIDDISGCIDAAIAGMGIIILPRLAVKIEVRKKHLVPILESEKLPNIDLYAVYPNRQFLPAKLKYFLAHLSRAIGA